MLWRRCHYHPWIQGSSGPGLLIQCWLQAGCGFQSPKVHGMFPAVSQIHTFGEEVTLTWPWVNVNLCLHQRAMPSGSSVRLPQVILWIVFNFPSLCKWFQSFGGNCFTWLRSLASVVGAWGTAAALELHFFYYLISCVVDESPTSVVNPHNFPIKLSIAPTLDSDTGVQMAVQPRPSPSLTFSHAKYTNGVLPLRCSRCIWLPWIPARAHYGTHTHLWNK